MKERHWSSLITSIRHGQSILVLGPGIPATQQDATGTATADTSLAQILQSALTTELEEDNRLVTGETLAAVAQQYEDAQGFGPNALRALTENTLQSPAYSQSSVHSLLAGLPIPLVITSCQDDHLSRAMKEAGKEPIVQRYNFRGDKRDNPEFMQPKFVNSPVIYHLFGNAQEPASLAISENDLLDLLVAIVSDRPPLPNSLVRALKRPGLNFLFLGFGITHWYLRVFLKILVRVLELDRSASSIATEPLTPLSDVDKQRMILFYQRGTRIEVEDADIHLFLSELSQRLQAQGGMVDTLLQGGPNPRVFISYAREDGDLAAAVFDALQKADFEPWMDTESLDGGDLWNSRIKEELDASDFTLILHTPTLSRKMDSYVNKELALARDRALSVRGNYLIPLRTEDLSDNETVEQLNDYHQMPLATSSFADDMAQVVSTMRREYQRRRRH
jgi:TIR domain/SIR2-like domain